MITRVFVAVTSLALMGVLVRGWAQGVSQEDAERYIIQSERQWAESLATGDAGIVRKILADDFVGRGCHTAISRRRAAFDLGMGECDGDNRHPECRVRTPRSGVVPLFERARRPNRRHRLK